MKKLTITIELENDAFCNSEGEFSPIAELESILNQLRMAWIASHVNDRDWTMETLLRDSNGNKVGTSVFTDN